MSDIYDKILEKLPPSTIRLIENYRINNSSRNLKINSILRDIHNANITDMNTKLKRKLFDIQLKTAENKSCMEKLQKELEDLKSLKKTPQNEEVVRVYTAKINELELALKTLVNNKDFNASLLFTEIEELDNQIKEYRKKISQEKSRYQSYENFPPDIDQAKEVIAKIKEKIKENETAVESLFPS